MSTESSRQIEGYVYLVLFALCIPAANWMIGNVGTFCVPDGPCLIPVAPGVEAPSGVVVIGMAFVLRDLVQRRLGIYWAFGAVVAGALLSGFVAPVELVYASAFAFFISESVDLAVYTPIQRRNLVLAVLFSSAAGLVVDSIIFLWLAFGSLDFLLGQIVGKLWMVLIALPFVWWLRRRDDRLGIQPA